MGVIFALSGSKAVGKSTLINGLKKKIPGLITREGFRQTNTGLSLDIEEEYYENERWYFKREIEEYIIFRSISNPVLLLRGPEDMEFYALHYPRIKKHNWDVEKNLAKELKAIRMCRSDYIIYLDASPETIMMRKVTDLTKARKNMDDWVLNWQPYIEAYIKGIPYTKIFDTDNADSEMILNMVSAWMLERINQNT